jgi:hypothetical protein
MAVNPMKAEKEEEEEEEEEEEAKALVADAGSLPHRAGALRGFKWAVLGSNQ